jgi:hypothetical protein
MDNRTDDTDELRDAITIASLPRPPLDDAPELLELTDCARITGISINTLRYARRRGLLAVYDKIGHGQHCIYRITRDALDAYAARHERETRGKRK